MIVMKILFLLCNFKKKTLAFENPFRDSPALGCSSLRCHNCDRRRRRDMYYYRRKRRFYDPFQLGPSLLLPQVLNLFSYRVYVLSRKENRKIIILEVLGNDVLSDESNAECDKDCSLSCRIFIQDSII